MGWVDNLPVLVAIVYSLPWDMSVSGQPLMLKNANILWDEETGCKASFAHI